MSTEKKTGETTLSIKSLKKLAFQKKYGLEKCLEISKSLSSKTDETQVYAISQPLPKVCILQVTQFSADYKKLEKFVRKSLVTIPILKCYMVPEAQKL